MIQLSFSNIVNTVNVRSVGQVTDHREHVIQHYESSRPWQPTPIAGMEIVSRQTDPIEKKLRYAVLQAAD